MPDTGSGGSRNNFGFLSRKLGPAPVWLWALLAVGAYYLWTKYKGGSSAAGGAQATDPATGVTYAQELSDAEDQITQLQAQVNSQQQGQAAPDVTTVNVTETEPGSGTPAPKPPAGKPPEALGSADYRDLAIQALRDKGIKSPTPQQIADEQNDIRATVGLGKATGKPPPGGGTDTGVTPPPRKPATKAKATARPRRPAPAVRPGGPVRVLKPRPAPAPARRAA